MTPQLTTEQKEVIAALASQDDLISRMTLRCYLEGIAMEHISAERWAEEFKDNI